MIIFGDYFNQDSRALISICETANIPYEFRLVDQFERDNFSEAYKMINPNSTIPTLKAGQTTVIGQKEMYMFLIMTNEKAAEMLYSEKSDV